MIFYNAFSPNVSISSCSFLSDAIRAVDEVCDESQRTRVRKETARIVSISFNFLDLMQRLSRFLI